MRSRWTVNIEKFNKHRHSGLQSKHSLIQSTIWLDYRIATLSVPNSIKLKCALLVLVRAGVSGNYRIIWSGGIKTRGTRTAQNQHDRASLDFRKIKFLWKVLPSCSHPPTIMSPANTFYIYSLADLASRWFYERALTNFHKSHFRFFTLCGNCRRVVSCENFLFCERSFLLFDIMPLGCREALLFPIHAGNESS